MMIDRIRAATPSEGQDVVGVLTAAFHSDPAVRWMFPKPAEYFEHFPQFVQAFGGAAFHHQTAHVIDGLIGAALWLPPGASPDEKALEDLFQRAIPESRRKQLLVVFELMSSYHPRGSHWHLPLIGIDPRHQGQGWGSALLAEGLNHCDQSGQMAYLECSNPAHIALYQKHGFELIGEIQIGSCPAIFPMERPAQPTRSPRTSVGHQTVQSSGLAAGHFNARLTAEPTHLPR
jgi:ribosomal protein S18 acetylase RimI-like enzyme